MRSFCHNEEMMAAYIDNRLDGQELVLFERHLSNCSECLSELINIKREYDEVASADRSLLPGIDAGSEEIRKGGTPLASAESFLRRHYISTAAILVAFLAFAALSRFAVSPAWDPGIRKARVEISQQMNATMIGELRLSCGRILPQENGRSLRGSDQNIRLLEGTESELRSRIEKEPGSIENRRLLGHIFMIRSHPAMARIYYDQILDIRPGDPSALNDLAVASYRMGELARAESYLSRALSSDEAIPESYYNLAVVKMELGDIKSATEWMEKYLEMDNDSPWAARLSTLLSPSID